MDTTTILRVSDDDATPQSDAFGEIVDESRHYVLAMTESGWSVWDRESSSEEPLARFPLSDEGFDLASDYFAKANRTARGRPHLGLGALRWIALVAGGVWVVSTAVVQVWFYLLNDPFAGFDGSSSVLRWAQALSTMAYPVFLVAVGAYVLLWLRGHADMETHRSDGRPQAGNPRG